MSNKNWVNRAKNLDSVMSAAINKMHVYQQFGVDIVPSPGDFIQNETPSQVTSCEFWEIFNMQLY